MVNYIKLDSLIKRLKEDASNSESEDLHSYLAELLETGNLTNPAAIGSAKMTIDNGLSTLSEAQLQSIALEIYNNDLYLAECPICSEKIEWADMYEVATHLGRCPDCDRKMEEEGITCNGID
ncbi:hypothetical protein ACS4JF_20375 [Bacillus thuringiensis]|uniref:hypothetical protein n=1 Tax=Bacillus thuringiensis TaxID=1428 RepID=UPI000A389CB9|nr:hypothetical protein [Bacillus thuringiensis]OUB70663.1 hypothetical protein BK744_21075 [Bacillus thuringiensis serovar zhaodongensis]